MPTKGARRAHEAFTNVPANRYAPTTTPEVGTITGDGTPQELGGGWTNAAGPDPANAGGPVELGDLEQEPAPVAGAELTGSGSDDEPTSTSAERTPVRTYQAEPEPRSPPGVSVEIQNITDLRQQVRDGYPSWSVWPATISIDGHTVTGEAMISAQRPGFVVSTDGMGCDCGESPNCAHRNAATGAVGALMNGHRIRSSLTQWNTARQRAATALAEAAATQEDSRARPERPADDGEPWANNTEEFQDTYDDARARQSAGETVVPYMSENATGGLGDREGGRGFGVEIEFDLDGVGDRRAAIAAIGADLQAAGLTNSSTLQSYHSGRRGGYTSWTLEADSTVSGEIVSPIMYDEPRSWDQLAQVCEIVRRHGGHASVRCGGHVHVSCGDYDHTVENHNRLLALAQQHEDVLYRLATNPERRTHRGTRWCSPNTTPTAGYNSVADVRARHGNHGTAMNFEAVRGHGTDHVEYRLWDGSLDPGTIQTQIKLSLAMTEEAFRRDTPVGGAEPLGSHRERNSHLQRGQRLTGPAWSSDTSSFRQLLDLTFRRQTDKAQATALFAANRWQRRR